MLRLLINVLLSFFVGLNMVFAANIDSLMTSANEHYKNGKFDEAINSYESIIKQGFQSDVLYFNLGNAYFKHKNIPAAILNYERAQLLNPGDDDIRFNLDLSRTFTVDKIEPLPEFLFTKFLRSIRNTMSTNGWAYLGIILFTFTLLSAAIFWFTYRRGIKKITFSIGLITLVITITSFIFSYQQKKLLTNHEYGIIFPSVIAVKSSPGVSGKDLFILHSGTKVKITNSIGDWLEIKIADGNKGWALSDVLQRI